VLSRLFNYCAPMLGHLNNDIDKIESQIFSNHGLRLITEIALIKKNIVNFRKAMQAHKSVICHLVNSTGRFFPNLKLDDYFKNLIEQTKEIWDLLENNRDTIDSLHETRMSLSSYRLNQILRILTIVSVIFMPINLIAFLFGMKTVYHPLVGLPFDFWLVVGMMAIVALVLIVYFKKKKWL
jgi:magnesium transporter